MKEVNNESYDGESGDQELTIIRYKNHPIH